MTPSDASRIIETTFSTSWALCPVVFENLPVRNYGEFGQPFLWDGTDPFIQLEISHGSSRAVTVPIGCVRRYGFLIVSILIPRDTGSRRVDDIIGALSALLQFKTFDEAAGQIRFKDLAATSRNTVIDEWVRTVVVASFEYDEEVE